MKVDVLPKKDELIDFGFAVKQYVRNTEILSLRLL